jgi:hypothetical protein
MAKDREYPPPTIGQGVVVPVPAVVVSVVVVVVVVGLVVVVLVPDSPELIASRQS